MADPDSPAFPAGAKTQEGASVPWVQLKLLFATAVIGFFLRGESRLLCAPRPQLIVAGAWHPQTTTARVYHAPPAPGRAVRSAPAQSRLLYSELIRRYFCLDFSEGSRAFLITTVAHYAFAVTLMSFSSLLRLDSIVR